MKALSTPPAPASVRTIVSNASLPDHQDRPDRLRLAALVFMHLGCLAVPWVGASTTAVALAAVCYLTRAFGLTAFYHRYFSHRAFRTSRWFQFAARRSAAWPCKRGRSGGRLITASITAARDGGR